MLLNFVEKENQEPRHGGRMASNLDSQTVSVDPHLVALITQPEHQSKGAHALKHLGAGSRGGRIV